MPRHRIWICQHQGCHHRQQFQANFLRRLHLSQQRRSSPYCFDFNIPQRWSIARLYVESEELLGGVFFLCDDKAASAITGVVLPIDAGFSAYSGV